MQALKLFSKHAPNKTFIAVVLGSLSGLFYAMLIPVVMEALSESSSSYIYLEEIVTYFGIEVSHSQFAILFLALCILILIFKSLSEIVLSRIALDIRFLLRKDLYEGVQNSPIASLEKVGASRLIQAISTDVSAIVTGSELFPILLTNSVTLIGMLGYLAYLDFATFLNVIKIIVFGVITYQIPVFFGAKYFSKARDHMNILQEAFRGTVEGAKELKLSKNKRNNYRQQVLYKHEEIVRTLEKKGITFFSLASNYGGLLCFFAIGGISFILVNYRPISNAEIIATVMVLLYVTGPIAIILNSIPLLAKTRISLKKIEQLYQELPNEDFSDHGDPIENWEMVRLRGIKYRHLSNNQNKSFQIGPIDLEIRRGMITFIAGGNGSGKSTLAKIISHHYLPSEGSVDYDGNNITSNNINEFRQQITSIYSDYYLFDRLLDIDCLSSNYKKKVEHYLRAFGLENKVGLKDGKFTTLKLSDGQRRRLALVVAIVEDKSLLVFDEWAADQDPQFKNVFYNEILPYLKSKNKAVVVISHDDRYFNVADQLFFMDSGKIVKKQLKELKIDNANLELSLPM